MMRVKRFYCTSINAGLVRLAGPEAHHLINVLRLKAGDSCELFDGAGTVATAVIKQLTRREVMLEVNKIKSIPRPFKQNIIIASSIAKGKRFDWLIEKCTELGVDRIIPVIFTRTIKTAKGPKIQKHWQNGSISAAKQSGTIYLPQIDTPLPLYESLEIIRNGYKQINILFGNVKSESISISEYSSCDIDIAAFVGPEGGLTEDEIRLLEQNGAAACCISDRVLRIETAAVVFSSILTVSRFVCNSDKQSKQGPNSQKVTDNYNKLR